MPERRSISRRLRKSCVVHGHYPRRVRHADRLRFEAIVRIEVRIGGSYVNRYKELVSQQEGLGVALPGRERRRLGAVEVGAGGPRTPCGARPVRGRDADRRRPLNESNASSARQSTTKSRISSPLHLDARATAVSNFAAVRAPRCRALRPAAIEPDADAVALLLRVAQGARDRRRPCRPGRPSGGRAALFGSRPGMAAGLR